MPTPNDVSRPAEDEATPQSNEPTNTSRVHNLGINFFLCVSLSLLAIGFSAHPLLQTDLPWQIRTGYNIISTGNPPHADTFSWTRFGRPWAVNEWLTFTAFYEFFITYGGFAGVWIFMAAMLALMSCTLFLVIKRIIKSPMPAFFISFLAILAPGLWFQPRPFLFTYFFIIVTMWLCVEARRGSMPSKRLWLLPICFAVWANFHQGVAVGVGILFLFAVGDILEAIWRKSKGEIDEFNRLRTQSVLFFSVSIGGFAASLLTPYNIQLYKLILLTVTDPSVIQQVAEWRPLTFTLNLSNIAFVYLAVASLYGLIRQPKERSLGSILVFIILLYQAISHKRNEPIFVMAAAVLMSPVLAANWRNGFGWISAHLFHRPSPSQISCAKIWTAVSLIFICAATLSFFTWSPILQLPQQYPPIEKMARYSFKIDSLPTDAAGFVHDERFPENMRIYNDYNIGGYLIFSCPLNKVFVDGRDDIYYGDVLDHAVSIDSTTKGQTDLRETDKAFLRSYNLDCVFTQNSLVARFYAHDPGWTIVYYSVQVNPGVDANPHRTWIFVRNLPQFSALISRCRNDIAVRNNGQPPISGF